MTRYSVDWSALGGHKVYHTRSEAQAHAVRIKVHRGEDAVITELEDQPSAGVPAKTPSSPAASDTCEGVDLVYRDERGPAAADSDTGTEFPRATVNHGEAAAGALALSPNWRPATGVLAKVIDQILDQLEQDEDLRIAKHATAIKKYRERNSRGHYVWPRFRRPAQSPTGF
jgi:hypothetical protein